MSDDIKTLDDDDLPDLQTVEGRDAWIDILISQDDETLEMNGAAWDRCLPVHDGKNMILRLVLSDGTEEVFDMEIRRRMAIVNSTEESDRN